MKFYFLYYIYVNMLERGYTSIQNQQDKYKQLQINLLSALVNKGGNSKLTFLSELLYKGDNSNFSKQNKKQQKL